MRYFEDLTRNHRGRRGLSGGLVIALALVAALGIAVAVTQLSSEEGLAGKTAGGASGVLEMLSNVSDDPQNVLILGVDERPEVEGSRADTMMLARVYPETGEVKLAAIPRDFYVEVEPGVEDKINAAYSRGGVSGTIGAVENFTNVYIDHYAVVDFAAFEAIIDALGGLKIDVEEGQVPPNWRVKDEAQHLNGRRALIYARYRGTTGGDLDRISRQQEVMAALRSKALSWRSAEKFPRLARVAAENVDTDMTFTELASLGRAMAKHGRNGLMTYTQLEGTPETLSNGSKVLVPDAAENESTLQEFRN